MSQLGGQGKLLGAEQTLGRNQVLGDKSVPWCKLYHYHPKSWQPFLKLFKISCVCRCRNSGVPCSTGMIFNPAMCRQAGRELTIWQIFCCKYLSLSLQHVIQQIFIPMVFVSDVSCATMDWNPFLNLVKTRAIADLCKFSSKVNCWPNCWEKTPSHIDVVLSQWCCTSGLVGGWREWIGWDWMDISGWGEVYRLCITEHLDGADNIERLELF